MCDSKGCSHDNIEKGRTTSKPLKGDKRYKDAPRFKVIYGYEDDFKTGFMKEMVSMQKELLTTMNTMGPKKK
jgi:hypothetical protein